MRRAQTVRTVLGVLTGLWVLALVGQGCESSPTPPPQAPTATQFSGLAQVIAEAAQQKGIVTAQEAQQMLYLRSENGWDILQTPATPGPQSRILFFVMAAQGLPTDSMQASLRWTSNDWQSHTDLGGQTLELDGRRGWVFDMGKHPADSKLQAAFQLQGSTSTWLNHGNQNYRISVLAPRRLEWVGQMQVRQNGLLRNLPGDSIYNGHPVELSVETFPISSQVELFLHWTTGDFDQAQRLPMRLSNLYTGSYGNNAKWMVTLPSSAFQGQGALIFWVEAKGPQNTLWDSRDGANYKAKVIAPPVPTWAQVGVYSWTKARQMPDGSWRYNDWFYNAGMGNPIELTPGQYQVYASAPIPALELYIPGITDQSAGEGSLGSFVRVEVWSPFFSGSPTGEWKAHAMSFREKNGNNFRFQWNVREFRAPNMPAIGVSCAEDGTYPFKYRVSTDGGTNWFWVGTQGLPQGGENRFFVWKNLSYPPQLSVSNQNSTQPWTLETTAGQAQTKTWTLVNTNSQTIQVEKFWLQQSNSHFSLEVPGCPQLSSCQIQLKSGERIDVKVTLHPTAGATTWNDQLLVSLFETENKCYRAGSLQFALQGSVSP